MVRGSSFALILCVALLLVGVYGGCKAPTPDASSQVILPKCVANSQWMEGNACTDSCKKEMMRCTAEMTFGCYCIDDYRKVNDECVTKDQCT